MKRALKTTFVVIILALSLSAQLVAAGPLEDADAAIRKGDYATTLRLLRPLANQGNASAQSFLGFMYKFGIGVPRDYAEAVTWYRKAADQGDAAGQYSLGLSYKYGKGVPQDYVSAYMWLSLSTASQPAALTSITAEHRDEVASKMTPAQIAEAQKLAREWKPVRPQPPWQTPGL